MNQNAPQPSFELPSLPQGEGASSGYREVTTAPQPEKNVSPATSDPVLQTAAPVYGAGNQPTLQGISNAAPIDPSIASSVPMVADDTELIEKEWVEKAKQIVTATKEDPYTQTKEMSKFKADYLKKRYNKDLKVEES